MFISICIAFHNYRFTKIGINDLSLINWSVYIQKSKINHTYIPDPAFQTLTQSLRELTQAIRVMQRDMQVQARETRQLHEVLRQCEMCRRQERRQERRNYNSLF